MTRISKAITNAATAAGFTVAHATDAYVGLISQGGGEYDFYQTKHGWLAAYEQRDGTFQAPTARGFYSRTGLGMAQSRNLDTLANMGPQTYTTAAAAIRAAFKDEIADLAA